ncbi:MAG: hypothetical protein AAGG11_08000 [Pseudomonadota bacterium]
MKDLRFRLLGACAVLLLATPAFSDHHAAGPLGYGLTIGFDVSDPAAFVSAIDKRRASELGTSVPVGVSLNQVLNAGDMSATHTVGVFYSSAADMDAAAAVARGSKELAEFQDAIRPISDGTFRNMWSLEKMHAKEGAVTSESPVSLVYSLVVTNPAVFMPALEAAWNSEAMKAFPGNVFFIASFANGDSEAAHYVSFQANDMATLTAGMREMMASPAMAAYRSAVASARTIEAEAVSRRVKSWPMPSP